MTLPFDIPDKHKRKYQCFVCGVMFTEFPEYKEHIIEEHDEGREYVLCPLVRCGAPIRDLSLHFKVKHPSERMPKKGQLKAMIWKDFSPKGKARTRKPKFRTGWHESTKSGKTFKYRSGYEKKVYEYLDEDNEVLNYEAEPFTIDYIHKGKAHKYTPDLFVCYLDGNKEVWEVKPANQTLLEQNKNKWHAAKGMCKVRGWGWRVITESEIEKLRKKIRNQKI